MSPWSHPDKDSTAELRRGEFFLWLFWNLGLIYISSKFIATWLLLIHIYGWSRVQSEHLRILAMPKRHPWPVSNGDMLAQGHSLHFLIGFLCWIGLFLLTYPALRCILPRRRTASQNLLE